MPSLFFFPFFFFQSEVHHTLIVFQTLTSFPTQQDLSHSSLSVHPIITDIVKIHAEKICPRRVRWRWQVWEKSLLTETFFFLSIHLSMYRFQSAHIYLRAGERLWARNNGNNPAECVAFESELMPLEKGLGFRNCSSSTLVDKQSKRAKDSPTTEPLVRGNEEKDTYLFQVMRLIE